MKRDSFYDCGYNGSLQQSEVLSDEDSKEEKGDKSEDAKNTTNFNNTNLIFLSHNVNVNNAKNEISNINDKSDQHLMKNEQLETNINLFTDKRKTVKIEEVYEQEYEINKFYEKDIHIKTERSIDFTRNDKFTVKEINQLEINIKPSKEGLINIEKQPNTNFSPNFDNKQKTKKSLFTREQSSLIEFKLEKNLNPKQITDDFTN